MSNIGAKLLDIFLENKGIFLTSKFLAQSLETSDKTIRKYIVILNDDLKNNGAHIYSKQGYGFKFEISDSVLFDDFLIDVKKKRNSVNVVDHVVSPQDRERFILNKLLFDTEQITLVSLSQQLFLSKTSISNVLNGIKYKIKKYKLTLEVSAAGIKIVGIEKNKRHFIKDYFFSETFQKPIFSLFEEEILEQNDLAEIILIVIDSCKHSKLSISDFVIHNLVIHIALMMKRLKANQIIDYPEHQLCDRNLPEYSVAVEMTDKLSDYFSIRLPIQETDFICLHLIGSQISREIENSTLRGSVLEAFLELENELGVDIIVDEPLLQNIETHIKSLIMRLQNGIQLANPLKNSILEKYDMTIQTIITVFGKIPELLNFTITDDEWVYISLHILATLEKQRDNKRYDVLLVCATGIGSARFLKNRIEKRFKDKIVVKDIKSYLELTSSNLSSFDFVITSIDLSDLFLPLPIIQVNILLEKEDVINIESFMEQLAVVEKNQFHKEIVLELMTTKQFLYIDTPISKKEFISLLLERLTPKLTSEEFDEFHRQIELRENLGVIVFNQTFAFPHPMAAITQNEQIVIGVSKHAITWDEQHKGVHVVFLISPSKLRNEKLKIVSPILAEFAEKTHLYQELLLEPTLEKFISLL